VVDFITFLWSSIRACLFVSWLVLLIISIYLVPQTFKQPMCESLVNSRNVAGSSAYFSTSSCCFSWLGPHATISTLSCLARMVILCSISCSVSFSLLSCWYYSLSQIVNCHKYVEISGVLKLSFLPWSFPV